jgi:hypothetical protein
VQHGHLARGFYALRVLYYLVALFVNLYSSITSAFNRPPVKLSSFLLQANLGL